MLQFAWGFQPSPPNCSLHGSCEIASQMRLVILECDNQSGRSHNGRNSAKCRLENDTRSCRNIYHSKDLMPPHLRLVMEHPRRAEFQKQRERSVKLVKKVVWKKMLWGRWVQGMRETWMDGLLDFLDCPPHTRLTQDQGTALSCACWRQGLKQCGFYS